MARDRDTVYKSLYNNGPLEESRLWELLRKEGFKGQWVGAQNTHGQHRIAIVATPRGNFYGLTYNGQDYYLREIAPKE